MQFIRSSSLCSVRGKMSKKKLTNDSKQLKSLKLKSGKFSNLCNLSGAALCSETVAKRARLQLITRQSASGSCTWRQNRWDQCFQTNNYNLFFIFLKHITCGLFSFPCPLSFLICFTTWHLYFPWSERATKRILNSQSPVPLWWCT